jgi:hypothetical protein
MNEPFSLRLSGNLPLLVLLLHHILIQRAHLCIRLSCSPSRVQGWLSLLAIGCTPEVLGITQRVRLAFNNMLLLALKTLAYNQGVQIERLIG